MRIKDHGFWASKLFYYQSILHYYWLAYKFKSFTFFTLANPRIKLGGMLDDRKTDTYDLVPSRYLPKTILYNPDKTDLSHLVYPLIAKPNVGFKGFNVSEIKNLEELNSYISENQDTEIILQEFIHLKREYSILFYKLPKSQNIGISSFVEKTFPFVIGDGKSDLEALIDNHTNPFLNKTTSKKTNTTSLKSILKKGEKRIIERIGNYSRGSRFISLNHCIDDQLLNSIDDFQKQLNGIHFFRLDLKSNDIDAIKRGDFKILEINGAKGEPLHIYDKKIPWFQKIRDIKNHWLIMQQVVSQTIKEDEVFMPVNAVWDSFTRAKNLTK